jgi:hypothetical protein
MTPSERSGLKEETNSGWGYLGGGCDLESFIPQVRKALQPLVEEGLQINEITWTHYTQIAETDSGYAHTVATFDRYHKPQQDVPARRLASSNTWELTIRYSIVTDTVQVGLWAGAGLYFQTAKEPTILFLVGRTQHRCVFDKRLDLLMGES